MPQSFGSRHERRQFSRDGARHFAAAQHRAPQPAASALDGTKRLAANRAERRWSGWRGDISALVHGPHDKAWLYSGTVNGGGQARINAKRNARGEYWRTVTVRVSGAVERYFHERLDLIGPGARIDGRHSVLNWMAVDLDVHVPGAPAGAVRAEPVFRSEHTNADGYQVKLDHIEWFDADGAQIDTGNLAGAR